MSARPPSAVTVGRGWNPRATSCRTGFHQSNAVGASHRLRIVTDVAAAAADVGMVTNPLLGDEMTSPSQRATAFAQFYDATTTITRLL